MTLEIWQFSCNKMTIKAIIKDGYVIDGAAIISKFRGQPAINLINWMERFGGFDATQLGVKEDPSLPRISSEQRRKNLERAIDCTNRGTRTFEH